MSEDLPDLDTSLATAYLQHYLGRGDTLPGISLRISASEIVVTSRHKYLRIARDLGRSSIRAAVDRLSDQAAVEELLLNARMYSVLPVSRTSNHRHSAQIGRCSFSSNH